MLYVLPCCTLGEWRTRSGQDPAREGSEEEPGAIKGSTKRIRLLLLQSKQEVRILMKIFLWDKYELPNRQINFFRSSVGNFVLLFNSQVVTTMVYKC